MSELPVISVTELVTVLKEIVETALPPCCVEGEISNCKRSAAGHYYLTLKDDNSEIGAVIWRTAAARLKFQPKDGLQVLATGALQVYVARGSCQFVINRLVPQGLGELELAFRQLKERLQQQGLFDAARKRPLPKIPRRVALVTSPTGAAVRDMIQVMTRRWPVVQIVVVPVRVQGEGAAAEIASALQRVHFIPDVDVVITGRGGGSLEDLWAFNEEIVARAISECRVPVVSAVGHETDISIADLVADRRALTPSEAAELVVPSRDAVRQSLRDAAMRMQRHLAGQVERYRLKLQAIESRSVFRRPLTLIDERRQRCDEIADRLQRAIRLQHERLQQKLASVSAALDALSPLKVLARGYTLTTAHDGRLVRSVREIAAGDEISTRVADGTLVSTVQRVGFHDQGSEHTDGDN